MSKMKVTLVFAFSLCCFHRCLVSSCPRLVGQLMNPSAEHDMRQKREETMSELGRAWYLIGGTKTGKITEKDIADFLYNVADTYASMAMIRFDKSPKDGFISPEEQKAILDFTWS